MKIKTNSISPHHPSASMVTFAAVALLAAQASSADTLLLSLGNGTIKKFDLATGADLGVFANLGDNNLPWGITVDKSGNLYAATSESIWKITPAGAPSVFASTGVNVPYGLAFDGAGNLYAANAGNNTIEKFTPGGAASVFAATGLHYPLGLAFDGAGNLYVANNTGNTIEKFTPGGVGSVFARSGLSNPTGLAFDSAGNLYVANNSGNPQTIEKFTPDGIGSIFASTGFSGALGLAFDAAGSLYVASAANNKVERFTPDGAGSVFATLPFDAQPNFIAIIPETITPPPTNHPPVALCINITVSVDSNCLASASINNGCFDPDGDAITLTQVPTGPYPIGSNNVCLNVIDSHGASNVCCAVVFVVDTTPPIINCPTNILVTTDPGQCSAEVVFSLQASDCALADLTCDNPSGSVFPIGTTTVNCNANDASSNTATCSFTVTVRDNEAPIVACRQAPNPSGKKIRVSGKGASTGQNPDGYYQLVAKDNCDPNPVIYVQDTASSFVAGPFASGDIVKLIQNPGGTPASDPGTPPVVANIHLNGDAMVYAADVSGNLSPNSCLAKIPPKPKAD